MAKDIDSPFAFLRMKTFMLLDENGNATYGKDDGQKNK